MTNVPNTPQGTPTAGGDDLPPLPAPPPPPWPPTGPAEHVSAAAAGQAALVRIARTNMLRAISRECFAVDRDALPAPQAVRFDPRGTALQLTFDHPDEAQAWADRLDAGETARIWEMVGGVGYHATATYRGSQLDLIAVVPNAVKRPEQVPA